jgi:hypothetical protein
VLAFLLVACVPPPPPAESARAKSATAAPAPLARRAALPDDCAQQPGEPAPAPLRVQYTGVARAARCDREVYTIMGGVTHFLGVKCAYCHLEPDYAADTHNKSVANWMARELVPTLRKRQFALGETGEVWCQDCHAGKAKLLGRPRDQSLAIDWMTTHLVEGLDSREGKPLKCKDCHQGDLGSPQFRAKVILSELPGLSKPPPPEISPSSPAANEVAPTPTAPDSPPPPATDFGPR